MWIMLNDAFFSVVKKDCRPDELLVRARRAGDIEKVFGNDVRVARNDDADYLYRARIPFRDVARAMDGELRRIDYPNFKDTVADRALHDAYLRVWGAMLSLQPARPIVKIPPFTPDEISMFDTKIAPVARRKKRKGK